MADKTPIKANFTGTDVTSLGEFATGDTVPVASGGTGAATAADARTNLGAAALAGSASQSFAMLNGTVAGTLTVTGAITSTGTLSLTGASSTLGYGTDAGGTVTQATSKSTAVTLNKPCGQITMHNESLAAGATVSFTFSNSLLALGDLLFVQVTSPISGSAHYSVTAVSVTGPSCTINLKNEHTGALANSPVIGFAIIKGATS